MANGTLAIGEHPLSLDDLRAISHGQVKLALADSARERMLSAQAVVDEVVVKGDPVYGVNTGFGKFSEVQIGLNDLAALQLNLIRSHACGVGPDLDRELVRMILASKATALARGYSGCRPELVEMLLALYNHDVLPVIPAHGSVGASGDLAPLAHMALVLVGEGEASSGQSGDDVLSGADALRRVGVEPVTLGPKEGLSLINGTQVSACLCASVWLDLNDLVNTADAACAWSLEGMAGLTSAFDPRIHEIRGHAGAQTSAANVLAWVDGSEILVSEAAKRRVQDPYAIRCAPQVHGSVRDMLSNLRGMLETELNGVTDNPLVFADTGEVISGGNFHAEPVALISDQLSICAAELASISERRTFLLTDTTISGLPPFLVESGGLNSGFMLHHVTQAALVSANKTLAHPASVDSIPTSAGKEDHVSMATWAGFKAREILDRARTVLAIEIMAAAQAVELRSPLTPGSKLAQMQAGIRTVVDYLPSDRYSKPDIDRARQWVDEQDWTLA